MANILFLLNSNYPDDIRVRKEAKALIAKGHNIYMICLRRPKENQDEQVDGINVIRINSGNHNYVLAFWDIIMSVFSYHPQFYRKARKIIIKNNIDAVHVHDLPLGGTAIKLKYEYPNIKTILDLHENYPEGLKVWHQWKKGVIVTLKNKLFMNYSKWYRYEKKFCKQVDHIVAVVREMKEKLVKNHNVNESKITVFTNSEEKAFLKQPDMPDIYSKQPFNKIIAYCGGLGPHRGVDTVIKAMNLVKSPDCGFVISGYGSYSVMKYLQNLINELGLADKVIMMGKVPFNQFLSLMRYATIHVIPHSKNGHTDHTIPHKLFQGMLAGTPLLVSNVSPLARVSNETKAGIIFEADNEQDCAEKIDELLQNQLLRETLGKNGILHSLNGKYNWESDSVKICKMYDNLITN